MVHVPGLHGSGSPWRACENNVARKQGDILTYEADDLVDVRDRLTAGETEAALGALVLVENSMRNLAGRVD